jgi:hypothetical protein
VLALRGKVVERVAGRWVVIFVCGFFALCIGVLGMIGGTVSNNKTGFTIHFCIAFIGLVAVLVSLLTLAWRYLP